MTIPREIRALDKRLEALRPAGFDDANVTGVFVVEGDGEKDWRPQIDRAKLMGLIGPTTLIVKIDNPYATLPADPQPPRKDVH